MSWKAEPTGRRRQPQSRGRGLDTRASWSDVAARTLSVTDENQEDFRPRSTLTVLGAGRNSPPGAGLGSRGRPPGLGTPALGSRTVTYSGVKGRKGRKGKAHDSDSDSSQRSFGAFSERTSQRTTPADLRDEPCQGCSSTQGGGSSFIVCSVCTGCRHLRCFSPELDFVPDEAWFCSAECRDSREGRNIVRTGKVKSWCGATLPRSIADRRRLKRPAQSAPAEWQSSELDGSPEAPTSQSAAMARSGESDLQEPAAQDPASAPSAQALPSAPAVQALPSAPAVQALPSVPAVQALPSAPAVQALPSAPAVQALPSAPAVQALPSAPAAQALPSAPAVQVLPSALAAPHLPSEPAERALLSVPAMPIAPQQALVSAGTSQSQPATPVTQQLAFNHLVSSASTASGTSSGPTGGAFGSASGTAMGAPRPYVFPSGPVYDAPSVAQSSIPGGPGSEFSHLSVRQEPVQLDAAYLPLTYSPPDLVNILRETVREESRQSRADIQTVVGDLQAANDAQRAESRAEIAALWSKLNEVPQRSPSEMTKSSERAASNASTEPSPEPAHVGVLLLKGWPDERVEVKTFLLRYWEPEVRREGKYETDLIAKTANLHGGESAAEIREKLSNDLREEVVNTHGFEITDEVFEELTVVNCGSYDAHIFPVHFARIFEMDTFERNTVEATFPIPDELRRVTNAETVHLMYQMRDYADGMQTQFEVPPAPPARGNATHAFTRRLNDTLKQAFSQDSHSPGSEPLSTYLIHTVLDSDLAEIHIGTEGVVTQALALLNLQPTIAQRCGAVKQSLLPEDIARLEYADPGIPMHIHPRTQPWTGLPRLFGSNTVYSAGGIQLVVLMDVKPWVEPVREEEEPAHVGQRRAEPTHSDDEAEKAQKAILISTRFTEAKAKACTFVNTVAEKIWKSQRVFSGTAINPEIQAAELFHLHAGLGKVFRNSIVKEYLSNVLTVRLVLETVLDVAVGANCKTRLDKVHDANLDEWDVWLSTRDSFLRMIADEFVDSEVGQALRPMWNKMPPGSMQSEDLYTALLKLQHASEVFSTVFGTSHIRNDELPEMYLQKLNTIIQEDIRGKMVNHEQPLKPKKRMTDPDILVWMKRVARRKTVAAKLKPLGSRYDNGLAVFKLASDGVIQPGEEDWDACEEEEDPQYRADVQEDSEDESPPLPSVPPSLRQLDRRRDDKGKSGKGNRGRKGGKSSAPVRDPHVARLATECWNCGQTGHRAHDCPEPLNNERVEQNRKAYFTRCQVMDNLSTVDAVRELAYELHHQNSSAYLKQLQAAQGDSQTEETAHLRTLREQVEQGEAGFGPGDR